jgi:hypothetical protein
MKILSYAAVLLLVSTQSWAIIGFNLFGFFSQQGGKYGSGSSVVIPSASGNYNLTAGSITQGRTQPDCYSDGVVSMGANSLVLLHSVPNGALAGGDEIMIHLTQAPSLSFNVGAYQFVRVSSVSGNVVQTGNITQLFGSPNNGFLSTAKVQIVRVPSYGSIAPPSPVTLSVAGWNGDHGGILAFRAFSANSNISLDVSAAGYNRCGEGQYGIGVALGGGGSGNGGGGYGGTGGSGWTDSNTNTAGGGLFGFADLSLLSFGGSGGCGNSGPGPGGGIIFAAIRDNSAVNFASNGGSAGGTFASTPSSGGAGGTIKTIFDSSPAISMAACGGSAGGWSTADVGLPNGGGSGSCTGNGGSGSRMGPNVFGNFFGSGAGGGRGRTYVNARVYNGGGIPVGPGAVASTTPAFGSNVTVDSDSSP